MASQPPPTPARPAPGAAAPAAAPTGDEAAFSFGGEIGVSWVLVPVVVRERGGGEKRERLDAGDFRLTVDGRPVPIASFERRAEAPLSLVFLQDMSGSMANGGKLDASQLAIDYFLDSARFGDEFALATFGGGLTQVDVPFTEELATLRESVASWEAYGTTALHDAVAWVPEISLAGRNPKRAALLVTDGVDNASLLTPAEAREVVQRAQVPVYVLGLQGLDPRDQDRDAVFSYGDLLRLLARQSGGQYHAVTTPDELKDACASLAEDLRTQYVLSFPTSTGPLKDHRIEVTVEARHANVYFRRGYRGAPPATAIP